ncbi:hypothetical protein HDR61_00680 [bacterium]|nr:hypothetical protein [bacterium]
MPDQVRPPVLISRLMAFVLATALVVLGALVITLWSMFPLNRPQVFFLTTQMRPDMDIKLYAMNTDEKYTELYKISFIKEYIKARNEIVPNTNVMQRKWANSEDGIVNMWSTGEIFDEFTQTNMWNAAMYSNANIDVTCTVEFPPRPISERTSDKMTYTANFSYVCVNSDGQTDKKDYTIIIELEKADNDTIKWGDRTNNPLGLYVRRYEIDSGGTDPLDFE